MLWMLLVWRVGLDCVNSSDWSSFKVRFLDVGSKVIIELDWEVMTFGGTQRSDVDTIPLLSYSTDLVLSQGVLFLFLRTLRKRLYDF